MTRTIKFILIVNLFFFLIACSGDELSKEDQILQTIDAVKVAAENRSHKDVAAFIHKSYGDHKGLDKNQLLSKIGGYFLMHKNIHLFTKIEKMVFHSENKVLVTLYVAMAGNVISDASVLSSLRAKIYKFELQLIKEDEWLLQLADWERSSAKEMMRSMRTEIETI